MWAIALESLYLSLKQGHSDVCNTVASKTGWSKQCAPEQCSCPREGQRFSIGTRLGLKTIQAIEFNRRQNIQHLEEFYMYIVIQRVTMKVRKDDWRETIGFAVRKELRDVHLHVS